MKEIGEIVLQKIRTREVFKRIPNNCTLLDVGCGNDFFLLKTIKNVIKEGYGLDECVSTKDIGNLHIINYAIKDKLPFPKKFFDIITMLAVFEHLDYPKQIVSELYRILKPEGKVIMAIPSTKAEKLYKYVLLPLRLVNRDSVAEHRYYSREQLYKFFSKNRFKNIKIVGFELGFNILLEASK